MNPKFDLTGKTFHNLTVVAFAGSQNNARYWLCQCVCGQQKTILGDNLKRGLVQSCGCVRVASNKARTTHGDSFSDENNAWRNMRSRCNNPNRLDYYLYGGRGIKVCPQWDSYVNFLRDVGRKPSKQHSLDRLNVDGDYEPGNVRWATAEEQANNRRVPTSSRSLEKTIQMLNNAS